MHRKFILLALAVGTVLFTVAGRAWACSVCLGGASDAVTDGYNASVLFLMSTPYLVVGSIVGALLFSYRRALKRREQAENTETEAPIVPLGWKQEESGR
ncbi:MAG: hypothetical protein ACM3SP_17750 [Chloroflexota bacterium]